ncbi:ACRO protein, partial [Cephalopterus ornatus]|nr:ACRO protein [Cephalopterus ornatus]
QVHQIKWLMVHKHEVPVTESYDISLLELDRSVLCSPSVQLSCLLNATLRVLELKSCYVSGCAAQGTFVLQEAKVQLINTQLWNSRQWHTGRIHIQNLCAGYLEDGNDTWQGDTGRPLICKDNDADFFWQVGLTSWGIGCARAKLPSVYISTQSFYRWIQVQMG